MLLRFGGGLCVVDCELLAQRSALRFHLRGT
jgi:hypothetical protein